MTKKTAQKSTLSVSNPTAHPSASANRTRANLTIPTWLFDQASTKGALRGYGMSELVSRLLEKFVDEENARASQQSHAN